MVHSKKVDARETVLDFVSTELAEWQVTEQHRPNVFLRDFSVSLLVRGQLYTPDEFHRRYGLASPRAGLTKRVLGDQNMTVDQLICDKLLPRFSDFHLVLIQYAKMPFELQGGQYEILIGDNSMYVCVNARDVSFAELQSASIMQPFYCLGLDFKPTSEQQILSGAEMIVMDIFDGDGKVIIY